MARSNAEIPIYITRKSASGVTGTLTTNAYVAVWSLFLAQIAVVAWLVIALVTAIKIIVGWF